jgi:hypothetical protein
MEGLAASVVLIAILLGVRLVVGGPRLPARATPAEAIAEVAQEVSESVVWDWIDHRGPAHHRTMGGN